MSLNNILRVWDHLQDSDLPPPKEDLAKWEAEFNQLMSAQRDELDHNIGGSMQQAWEGGIGDFQESSLGDKPMRFDTEGLPILGDYVFGPSTFHALMTITQLHCLEKNNRYLDPSTHSPLTDAKRLLEQNGSLTEAALLLEAAIQKGELGEGDYEAWILLGETRNMDEREDAGMRALVEGVRRAEEAGASGTGMLVSNLMTNLYGSLT